MATNRKSDKMKNGNVVEAEGGAEMEVAAVKDEGEETSDFYG